MHIISRYFDEKRQILAISFRMQSLFIRNSVGKLGLQHISLKSNL